MIVFTPTSMGEVGDTAKSDYLGVTSREYVD
jgi:hypothetical protein